MCMAYTSHPYSILSGDVVRTGSLKHSRPKGTPVPFVQNDYRPTQIIVTDPLPTSIVGNQLEIADADFVISEMLSHD